MTTAFNIMAPVSLDLTLPWKDDLQQEERFKKLLIRGIIPFLLLFLLVPWLPVFETEAEFEERVVMEVILEPLEQVEPPPAKKPKPKPQPVKPKVKSSSPPAASKDNGSQSLSALTSQLSSLSSGLNMQKMQNKNLAQNTGGNVEYAERSTLGSDNATQQSGGIEVDVNAMSDSSGSLAAYNPKAVAGASGGNASGPRKGYSSYQNGKRDMESIRRTFEHKKSSVYALYTQALRQFPDLSGKFTFQLVIEPDGSISQLKLVNSELQKNDLERQILAKIKSIHFGAADVSSTTVQYKFVFLPS
ncbi:hypothetical protein SIN8267_02656 [Sinobacterium norvegicum]|uniref:Uncharacterized protein n=1 Tax=Sinobacterium norvegicum TaxID=1641715 RepID=A0ABM9AH29_9GAMM|nr:AgmX/PglI C-terminal domain-containing protein [Sinobacterium norvegicum]CAH0992524.1 hypothetical protein SIN8267_02656 [Sinobacterium norvegicum]